MNSIRNIRCRSRLGENAGSRARCSGVSLVELMIAMAISLFVIGSLLGVVMGASSAGRSRDFNAELQTNGRYALEVIKNDLQQSGYLGVSSIFFPDVALPNIPAPGAPIAVPNACDPTTIGRISMRVWGVNDPTANPYANTCMPDYLTGDILVVRGLYSAPETPPFSTSQVHYYSTYDRGFAFLGPTPPVVMLPGKVPPSVNLLLENVFYVSPFTSSRTENPVIPSLHRIRLDAGPAMKDELVAGGVEQMQLSFGQLLANGATTYKSADALAANEWDTVRSVRVWLLMRASRPEAGFLNTSTYDMGDHPPITVNDSYRRLLLDAVVALRN